MRDRPRRTLLLPAPCAALCTLWLASCLDVSPPGTAFASEPPGARVEIDGQDSGWVTPCLIALDVDKSHTVTIDLPGYAPRELLLVPEERRAVIDWYQAVNGFRSTVRFPILMPFGDFVFPLREVRSLSPERVFVHLHAQGS